MLSGNKTNSNVVEIQQLQQQNNSTPSSEDLLKQKIESLGKEIKSLQKQGQLDRGIFRLGAIGFISYLVATNWSAIASAFSTTGTAAAPIIGIVLGAVVGAAVLVGASYAAWRYRAEIKAGFKYAAEKTVDGAKYTAGKVKDASVYTAEKAREGTSSALKTMGNKMSNLGRSMSDLESIPDSIESQGQTVVLKTEEKTKNFNSVKEMFIKEVFEDKTVNSSALTKEIFSELKRKILDKAYSVGGQSGFKKDQLINQLGQQADFVSKLNAKKLQKLLAQDDNNLYEIFSDHHDEIKRIIEECKRGHKLSNSVENLNKVAGKYGTLKGSIQFGGSNVEKQLHEPSSSDLGVLDKTATTGQKPSGKQSIPVALPKVPESPTLEDERSEFVDQRVKKHVLSTPKSTRSNSLDEGTLTRSNSSDSGRSSTGSSAQSTPTRQGLPSKEQFDKELEEKLAKRRAVLDGVSLESITQKVIIV